MEDLSGFEISYNSEIIIGIFAFSGGEESHDTYYFYRKEMRTGDQVEKLLKELDLLKGKGPSSEARTLRRELRELGFHLKPKKEVTENDTLL